MSTGSGSFIRDRDEGEALWFSGTLTLVRVASGETGTLCVVELIAPKGMATPLHRQPEDPETFYVLEGEATFHADGTSKQVRPGATVHVAAGTEHAFRVDSETARILILTTAQHEAFFRAAGEPAAERSLPPAGPPDMDKLAAAAERHGVEILGPPPFSA
ncbi:MAG TPA: cupin domain-containing protein [Thermoleophilaceae bacterium]|nr:cupin domain-containing protein [Thermoleophilaceae bacterium]